MIYLSLHWLIDSDWTCFFNRTLSGAFSFYSLTQSRSSGGVAYARVASACYRHVATRYGGGCPALAPLPRPPPSGGAPAPAAGGARCGGGCPARAPLLRPLDSDDVDVQAEGVETLHGLFVAGCDPQVR